ncbi:MAG TPA: ATP12 family protein [Alphaproteobacteria bacterium]|nr:ATP12 family protein [Alphaproteobacteria bacterium]
MTRRIYKKAEAVDEGDRHTVCLDGKALRTPAGQPLDLLGRALSEAVAAEWSAQEGEILPETMPLMRLACTALDNVAQARSGVVDEVAAFAESDLLCHRAEAPGELAQKQHTAWQPWLDWAERTFGARLAVTEGVIPVAQDEDAQTALRAAVAACDTWQLTALRSLVQISGSLVLALAVLRGACGVDDAWALSRLEEDHQTARWGEDAEAAAAATRRRDFEAAARFLALLSA